MSVMETMQGSRPQRSWRPGKALFPFVDRFDLNEVVLGSLRIEKPLSARTDCFLQFYLKDPYWVSATSTGLVHKAPSFVLIGPHTKRREDLIWTGSLKVFTIRFSSVGFRTLFGIPASAIRDVAISADAVLGPPMRELSERLAEASDDRLALVAERFLEKSLKNVQKQPSTALALCIARRIRAHPGEVSVGRVAAAHGLSTRQTERIFQDFVGVAPKMFHRLERVNRAIRMAEKSPLSHWSDIAIATGYFDQSHLIRDFQALNGTTPMLFAARGEDARRLRLESHHVIGSNVAFVQSVASRKLLV